MYDPRDWYWQVGGDETKVWSSKRAGYFPSSDGTYQAWLAAGNAPTKIGSAAELVEVLQNQWAPFILNAGVALSSASNPALNATYGLDRMSQGNIAAITNGIANGKGLPGGGTTFNYPDVDGVSHAFDAPHFLDAAAAFRDFVYTFGETLKTLVNGGSGALPAAVVAIS